MRLNASGTIQRGLRTMWVSPGWSGCNDWVLREPKSRGNRHPHAGATTNTHAPWRRADAKVREKITDARRKDRSHEPALFPDLAVNQGPHHLVELHRLGVVSGVAVCAQRARDAAVPAGWPGSGVC